MACASLSTGPCAAEQRRRQRGVNPHWKGGANPTRLEWHWAAGLNVSDCSAGVVAGDWNAAFTRLRLQSALRLLEEAASNAQCRMPNAQCPNAPMPQCPMPNAQCPMPNAQRPMPNA